LPRPRSHPRSAPQQVQAKESRRTGRHEPIRSSTTRIATRGAGLGITLAAGVATGINYLEHDVQLALLAGGQVGTVAAGNPDTGRALGLLGRVAVLRALL
jgi:hypothetical protein